jgi:hypothetical protein
MDDKGKKSRLSSPQYVDYVMTFVQKTANDEAIFPTKVNITINIAEVTSEKTMV